MDKHAFTGEIVSIQPRIRLLRSFDEVSHTYLGYAIKLEGKLDNRPDNSEQDNSDKTIFSIGIGKSAHAKHQFKVNDTISGECIPVPDAKLEPVDYYKVSKLKLIALGNTGSISTPWELVPPTLEVYRERGHRRLAARTHEVFCSSCMWGCRMPVEIIFDNWNPRGRNKYRMGWFIWRKIGLMRRQWSTVEKMSRQRS